MKISKILFLNLLISSVVIPSIALSSCNNNPKSVDYQITHSGEFKSTIENCEASKTYSVSFDFTSNKEIDLNNYNLNCNTSSWQTVSSSVSYSWTQAQTKLTLNLSITLKSSFSIQEVVSADNLVLTLVEKSSSKTVSTFTFDALKIVLNEKLSEDEFIVSFETNGGSTVSAQKVKKGETATKPTTTKTDYSFVDWYNAKSAFDFSTPITSNLSLSAHWTESDPYDYIHNRSFSLGCWGIDEEDPRYYDLGWGTSWIISDATSNDTEDYTYWIATNWHVVDEQQSVESATINFQVGYADDKAKTGITPISGYTVFDSYQFEGYDKFYFDKSANSAIDFVVAKADFKSAPTSIKTKLNKLNYQQKTQGYINRFVDTTTSQHYESNEVYTGGFPVQNSQFATWESHPLPANDLIFNESYSHKVDSAETIDDNSYQYISQTDYGTSWMIGGASGSLLITKLNNEWSPIAIYWGGFTDYAKTKFYPCYSVFKSDKKDFIADYL